MATSGSTNYSTTTNEIIKDALITLNVVREDEAVAAEDYNYGLRLLNRMIKGWQAQGNHLWLKETAIIFLQQGQAEYVLKSTTTDHATLNYTQTSLDADYATGVTQVSFNDNVTVAVNDNIGIVLDDGSLYWDTISNVVDLNTVDLNGTLPSDAAENNNVYIYTTKLDQPFNVYSAIRQTDDEIDTPMYQMSYEEYFQQPNKTDLSTPVNYRYDRQLDSANIAVWPTPSDVTYRMKITLARRVENFDIVSNNPDWPQEWYEALVLNLATKLAHSHGKAGTPQYQSLKLDAANALQTALMFDNEPGSIYLQPDYYS